MPLFVTLEGGEGAGKSVVAEQLSQRVRATGADVVQTFEPGGTPLGTALRRHLFAEQVPLSPWAETFLFLADRAHHVAEIIRPALARGAVVICDRYTDSTLCYQGYGRRLDVTQIKSLNHLATGGLPPHLTLLLDVPVAEGLRRARRDREDRIGMEPLEFHQRVAEGFKRIAREEPDRVHIIDAACHIGEVVEAAWTFIEPRLQRMGYRTRR